MERLEKSHPVTIQWRSFELRPKEQYSSLSPDYLAKVQANRPRIYAMAKEQYGLEMNAGPFGINSRIPLAGAKYAESLSVGPAYHANVMRAYWQEAKAIDDVEALTEIAVETGLDGEAFAEALNDPTYIQAVLDDIYLSHDYGLSGVPAMIIADKYLISGAQPYEVLCEAVERVLGEA